MSTVKLKRLKIHQYRNVKPGTELHFDDGVNLVLGQNGSGKTTLLGLLSMVCGWYFAELEDEEFSIEFEMHRGTQRFQCVLSNHQTATQNGDEFLAYRYQLTFGDPEGQLHGTPGALKIIWRGTEIQAIPCSPFKHDFLMHIAAVLVYREVRDLPTFGPLVTLKLQSLQIATYRFDEGLACFHALTGEAGPAATPATPTASSIGLSLVIDLTKTPPRISRSLHQGPFATSITVLRQIFEKAGPDWTPIDAVPSDQVGFLAEAVAQLGFSSATLQLANPATSEGPPERCRVRMGGFHFQFKRSDNDTSSIPHEYLSYGQKRLLAFYYYLANNDAFIIADELVNGLHHRWIDACMKAIGERQAFLTSQNPLLFDYVEFDSIEQVEARFITCKSELVDGAEQLVWQNMPRDDAERFYRGYEADIEGIGDILINRGLW